MDTITPPDLSQPLIISAALTGSSPSKAQNPAVPITPEEIVEAALACREAGASIVHMHVRDDEGKAAGEVWRFARIMELLRASGTDLVINFSTSGGVGRASEEDRLGVVGLGPDIVSFDCGSLNFGSTVFINTPTFLDKLAQECLTHGVLPEIECFEQGHIASALRLIEEGKLDTPCWFQVVLGVRGGAPGTIKQLVQMVDSLPSGTPWSACAIGRAQLPVGLTAMAMGGHVRTGLEDNIFYHKGRLAASNAELVARLRRMADEIGRPVASPTETRALLGLPRTVRVAEPA